MLTRALLCLTLSISTVAAEELQAPAKLTVSLADDLLGQLAPDGKHVYFVSNRNAINQIFVTDLTAPAATLLFDEGADVTWPRVSPDGKRLAYVSFRDDATGQLCVRALPNLDRSCLAAGGALEVAWAGGDELVLLARGSVEGDLVLSRVRADKHKLRATPLLSRNLNGPAVSPDGKWLAYVPLERAAVRIGPAFAAQASRALVLRRLDGGGESSVTLTLPGGTSQPSFSSDGKWIYFTQFLNDTDQNGVLDGDDHGVVFRVPFAGDPAALASARPEQLTSAAWNCQYPSPAAARLILTCARGGSLDLYALPLDGIVPARWPTARVAEELEASRDRWERLLLLHHLVRRAPDARARATLLLATLRLHLQLGEYEAAAYHAREVGEPLAPLLTALIDERRALRAFDRGELGYQYLLSARKRLGDVAALPAGDAASEALRHVVLSELHDHLGNKAAALDELGRARVDASAPAFVVLALADRVESLYRQLDRAPSLVETLGPLVDHPSLPEAERLRLGGVVARTLLRGVSRELGHAAAAKARANADAQSALAFALSLWPCLDDVTGKTLAAGRACTFALYDGTRSLARRRLLVTEVVRRAEDTDADDLEYELSSCWVHDVPNDAAEERHAERLFRHVVEDYAYAKFAAGKFADAAADFDKVTREALSLEAHVGWIESTLAAGKDPRARYRGDAVEDRFARAYLELKRLPTLDGAAFDAAYRAATADVQAVERALPQRCEVQALRGALLHLGFLRSDDRALAEEANTHYLLALDLAHDNLRYRAMALEQLALLHAAVGNFRIAIGHFDERAALPFAEPRVALAHQLLRARAELHIGHDAEAARSAEAALAVAESTPSLARFLPLALDRAALYALDAGEAARALGHYDRADERARAGDDDLHNRVVRWLGRAAAAVAAGQPQRALDDLDRVDGAFAQPDIWKALDWPEATHDEERESYELLRLGLRGQAQRALGKLDDARRTLTTRHDLLLARAAKRSYDDDLLALATAETQLAELARARGDGAGAATLATQALAHADAHADKTATPLSDAQLAVLGYAAELHVVHGIPSRAFGVDVTARLRDAFDKLAEARDPARRETRIRFGVYLTLIGLDRTR